MNESAAAYFRRRLVTCLSSILNEMDEQPSFLRDAERDEEESKLEDDGIRIDGYREEEPRVIFRVRISSALADIPPVVKLHCNTSTTCLQVSGMSGSRSRRFLPFSRNCTAV